MPELADHIDVTLTDEGYAFTIDGQEFPFYLTDAGVNTTVERGRMPSVTVQIPANKVTVNHAPFAHQEAR